MSRKTPCYKCVAPKRHLGCHAKCQEYKDFRADRDAEAAYRLKQAQIEHDHIETFKPTRR